MKLYLLSHTQNNSVKQIIVTRSGVLINKLLIPSLQGVFALFSVTVTVTVTDYLFTVPE